MINQKKLLKTIPFFIILCLGLITLLYLSNVNNYRVIGIIAQVIGLILLPILALLFWNKSLFISIWVILIMYSLYQILTMKDRRRWYSLFMALGFILWPATITYTPNIVPNPDLQSDHINEGNYITSAVYEVQNAFELGYECDINLIGWDNSEQLIYSQLCGKETSYYSYSFLNKEITEIDSVLSTTSTGEDGKRNLRKYVLDILENHNTDLFYLNRQADGVYLEIPLDERTSVVDTTTASYIDYSLLKIKDKDISQSTNGNYLAYVISDPIKLSRSDLFMMELPK